MLPGSRFQVWRHVAEQHRLLLRRNRFNPEIGERRCDVLFTGVARMNLPTLMDDLEILPGTPADLPAGVPAAEGHEVFLLRGRGWTGYVVARSMAWVEDDEHFDAPSSLVSEPFPPSLFWNYWDIRSELHRYEPAGSTALAPLAYTGRSFELVEYFVSHGQLLLRSEVSQDHSRRCDLYFKAVSRLDLPTRLDNVVVSIAPASDMPAGARDLGAWTDEGDPTYLIHGANGSGFVTAGILYHAEYDPHAPASAA